MNDADLSARLIVNATPVGMLDSDASPCPDASFAAGQIVYDLVYGPTPTRLVRDAQNAGATALDGLAMLIGQAAGAFRLWTGHDLPLDRARAAAPRRPLTPMISDILTPTHFDTTDVAAGFTQRGFASADLSRDAVRRKLADQTGFERVASVGQVHGADVATVADGGHLEARDGIVTAERGVLLTVVAADCALVLFADSEAGVVGVCHSGWRGTVAGIVGETISAMRALGADAERTRAWLAPCISVEAFEVGEEVAAQFPDAVVARRPEWPRPHVDLRAALAAQLAAAGVPAANVERADGCTLREPERFYSYRGEEGTPGRMIGFVGLRA